MNLGECNLAHAGISIALSNRLEDTRMALLSDCLRCCLFCRHGINIALSNRLEDTLEVLSLSNNRFGDIDLDGIVQALSRNRGLIQLWSLWQIL